MQVEFELQDAYRKNAFITSGEIKPSTVKAKVPVKEISPQSREVIAELASGATRLTLVLPPDKPWQAPFEPRDAQQWDVFLLAYKTDYEQAKAAYEEEVHGRQLKQLAQVTKLLRKCEQLLSCDERPAPRLMNVIHSFDWNLIHLPGFSEALELRERVSAAMAERAATKKARAAAAEEEHRQRTRQYHADKAAWIASHGSEHLKDAFAAGYFCDRLYLVERAQEEHPGYDVDLDNTADWAYVECPSPKALAETKTSGGMVVWLIQPVLHLSEGKDYGDNFIPCEAVVIRGYLGRTDIDLVRTI